MFVHRNHINLLKWVLQDSDKCAVAKLGKHKLIMSMIKTSLSLFLSQFKHAGVVYGKGINLHNDIIRRDNLWH